MERVEDSGSARAISRGEKRNTGSRPESNVNLHKKPVEKCGESGSEAEKPQESIESNEKLQEVGLSSALSRKL